MIRKDLPKISIVTPSYNQGEFLEDTIQSVLNQEYPGLEYIIMDGGSTDQSVEIIRKYEKYLTYWVSEKDNGQTDAINKGFRKATGDILAWINSDDFYCPDALYAVAQAYQRYPEAGLYSGNGYLVDKDGKNPKRYASGAGFDFQSLLKGSCYVLQPATFINRKAFEQAGYLDETLRYGMDLEYWLRISKTFDVVSIDAPLANYRWHEAVKTNEGFRRWVELWEIYHRYTDQEITPGLLVEFFSTLKKQFVLNDLEIDVKQLAEGAFAHTYALMQKALKLDDCIPTNRGTVFTPGEIDKSFIKGEKIEAPSVVHHVGSKPKIDFVLQATGTHAWGVGGGWANAAHKLGILNRVFSPEGIWSTQELKDDDGLWSYLTNPQADMIMLLGFDWHSQMLHSSTEWQERWRDARITKILYVQESIENNCRLFDNDLMKQSFITASKCCDAIVYTDITDAEYIQRTSKPALWQPFGVDDFVFSIRKEFRQRIARPFFRGQMKPHFTKKTYAQRRELLEFLVSKKAVDLLEYKEGKITPEEIAEDFNNYQIALNLPSLFSNHPSRVYEALGCGCALLTNLTGIPQVDNLFENRKHLIYYSNKEELIESVRLLSGDGELAERIAKAGYEYAMEKFTLDKHILQVLRWLNTTDQAIESPKKESVEELIQVTAAKPAVKAVRLATDKEKKILIDGVVFYLFQDRPLGICRHWTALLTELSNSPLADRIILLDRDSSAPFIPGIRRKPIRRYDDIHFEDDSLYLEDICKEENAEIFLSTYYTYPENFPLLLTLYDMIPELTGMDLSQPVWRAKAKAIEKAGAYLSISDSTKNDFRKLYPQYPRRKIYPTYCAVSDEFRPHTPGEISDFMRRYGIEKPYFMIVGHRALYKNTIQFFRAFSLLENKSDYEIVCTGGAKELEKLFLPYVKGMKYQVVFLNNADLSIAYSGAFALVFPSQYEGFGLPILEAMKSGCPVITCRNSSIPEVAGDAAIYVDGHDVAGMKEAIVKIQHSDIRKDYIRRGFENARRFSWKNTRSQFEAGLKEILEDISSLALNPTDPINTIGRLFYVLSKRPDREKLLSAMKQVYNGHTGAETHDSEKLLELEDTISGMNDDVLNLLKEAASSPDECDAFILYWYGLALEHRQSFEEALDAYLAIVNRADAPESLSGIVTYLASDIAYNLRKFELAKDLTEKFLKINPAFVEGQEKLKAIEEELKHGRTEEIKLEEKREPVQAEALESFQLKEEASKIKVSAIVSTYNSERFIRGCLEDLVNQTLYKEGELEIVVVDSGSQQDERVIVEEFQQRFSNIAYTRTEERETVYAAWNRGIKVASGKYITNANTDDRHRTDALEILSRKLDENPDIRLVYADCYLSAVPNQTFEENRKKRIYRYPDYLAPASLLHFQFGPQPMWRKEIHNTLGYFDGSYNAVGDYDFNIRFALHFEALHIPETLGAYLKHDDAVSFRDNAAIKEKKRVVSIYRKPDIIEKLYRKAGIPCNSSAEKAKAFLDLGIRAFEFYPPWNEGKPVSDLPFAIRCFKWAAEINPQWTAPHNNLAIAQYLSGARDEAINILEEALTIVEDSTARPHLQRLLQAITQQKIPTDLKLMASGLTLPSQQELYGKKVSALPVFAEKAGIYGEPVLSGETLPQAQPTPKLRVLFVVHKPPANTIAGTEIYTYTLAQTLLRKGHTVRVLYPKFDNTQPEGAVTEYIHEGLRITQLNLHQIPDMTYRFRNEKAASRFGKYLAGLDIDLVHFHNLFGISASALQTCAQLGIPTVMTMHDEWLLCEQVHYLRADGSFCEKGPETIDKCVQCYRERHPEDASPQNTARLFEIFSLRHRYLQDALKWIDTLIVPTAFLKESLLGNGFVHPDILVVPFGLHPFKAPTHEPQEGLVRFAYLGNINFTKGLDILIRAFNLIGDKKVQLDVYGGIQDPPYYQQTISRLMKDRVVHYHGPYKIEDLPYILAKTDISVIPSRSESYSFVVRESLQAGVPVIASRIGGIPEVVKDGENGLLFMPNDYKDLSGKLRFIIQNPRLITTFRKNIKPVRNIEEDADQLENIYRETANIKSRVEEFKAPSETKAEESASIIIVTFNSAPTIRVCLNTVLQYTPNAEVIVVDNASTDGTLAVLAAYEGRITSILNEENKGFSYACNQGIRASKGEYIILLNPDTVVTPNWKERLLAHFYPGVGAVGPLSNYTTSTQLSSFYAQDPENWETMKTNERAEKLYEWNRGQGRETKLLMGFCLALPRKVLDEVGLLDEDLFLGSEDLEISWRLRQKGYRLIIAADTFIYHEGQVSFKSQKASTSALTQESADKLYQKLEAYYGEGNVPHPMELWGIDYFRPGGAHFRSLRPTFAAVYCVYDDVTWLRESLESVYDTVDAVYFLVSDRPWYGRPTGSTATLDLINNFPDSQRKIKVVRGNWTNETDQRNAGLDILKQAGFTYCFVIDADEVYAPAELRRMTEFVISHPEVDCWHISLYTYWKSYHYRIEPRESLTPPVFVKVGAVQFTKNRTAISKNNGLIPPEVGICHHLSYARSDDEVLKKITTFSHAHEVQPGWFENIWKKWDSDHSLTNLHPTHPQSYHRTVEQPYSVLPPVLKKRYLADEKAAGVLSGLTSIIILAHNRWDQTELCLNNIARHTPEPHEIIVVDNGSTDETGERLKELVRESIDKTPSPLPSPARGEGIPFGYPPLTGGDKGEGVGPPANFRVISNKTNRGYAAGNNQGMAIARGEYILLLNNDTIVTLGWLGRMIDIFKRHPETGIVGPMSNNVTRPQLVEEVGYESDDGIGDFAAKWANEHKDRNFATTKASGFCLLARREVIDKIGGLDEQFGSGNFEDDDFCSRALLSGFEIRIAQDVFVHHTGRQTFIGAGIDYRENMAHNWKLYKEKWGIPKDTPMENYWIPSRIPEGLNLYIPLPEQKDKDFAPSPTPPIKGGEVREIYSPKGEKVKETPSPFMVRETKEIPSPPTGGASAISSTLTGEPLKTSSPKAGGPAAIPSPLVGDLPIIPSPLAGEGKGEGEKHKIKDLTSIIILLSGQREYARKCVESVQRNTKEPHEIIFIPREASYAPPKWLRKLLKENGNYQLIRETAPSPTPPLKGGELKEAPPPIKVGETKEIPSPLVGEGEGEGDPRDNAARKTSSEQNKFLSYARACNTGIAESKGEYIVILRDDTIVTEGWLAGMIECLNISVDIGIVGPMTVNVEGPQEIIPEVGYDPGALDAFAAAFRERNRDRRVPVKKLDSPCIAFRREVTDKTGPFDETYETGDYAVADYCITAATEDFVNAIAGGVFIHYYGHTPLSAFKDRIILSKKWGEIDKSTQESGKTYCTNALFSADEMSQKGQKEKAAVTLVDAIKLYPDEKRLHHALAQLLIEGGKFREALDVLEYMPAIFKGDAKTLELLGNCKIYLGESVEADRYADEILLLDNTSPKAWNLKGTVAFQRGAHEEAEKFFQKAMESDGGFGEAYANIGALRWAGGDKEEALKLFERAFVLSPTVEDIVTNYYTAAVSLSKLPQTEILFREAAALYPFNRRLKFILIDDLLQQQKYADAMDVMEEAMFTFGADDDTLTLALKLRDSIGPVEIGHKDKGEGIIERTPALPMGRELRNTISLCMIVKDEESNIMRALRSVKPVVDEMVVVDTGSVDRTKKIARAYGAKVYDFMWTDSFSDARNFGLSKASGEWILVLDADEVISPSDYGRLRELVTPPPPSLPKRGKETVTAKEKPIAYSFVTRNYVGPVSANWHPNEGKYREEAGSGWFPSSKVRLFPNISRAQFEKPVHETVEDSLIRAGIEIKPTDIPIHHYGKLDKNQIITKGEEYYQLGKKKLSEKGDRNPNALYELAVQATELEKYEEGLEYWKELTALRPDIAKAHYGMGTCLYNLGKYEEARTSFRTAALLDNGSKDARIMHSVCELLTGNAGAAIADLERFLKKEPDYPLALLACTAAFFSAGMVKEGLVCARKVKSTQFGLAPYLSYIAKLLISARRYDYAASLLERAVESGNTTDETRQLLAECREKKLEINRDSVETRGDLKKNEIHGDSSRPVETGVAENKGDKEIGTFFRIGNFEETRHPREGGGPLETLENVDSRLRGNDDFATDVSGLNKSQVSSLQSSVFKSQPASSLNQSQSVSLSLCMIVKDEEDNIERALRSVRPVVDEMIVVDTGSADRTKEIAQALGAKVYDFKWTDSFSDARNFAISKATGAWIVVLDADEVIASQDHEKLRELVEANSRPPLHPGTPESSNPAAAYSFVTRTYVEELNTIGWTANTGEYKDEEMGTGWFPGTKVRLFPNRGHIRFDFPLHERIEPSLIEAGIEVRKCDIPVHHYGNFVKKEKAHSKAELYYELGKRKIEEQGEKNFMAFYELAIQGMELGKHEEALGYLERVIAIKPDFPKAYQSIGNAYYNLKRYEEALPFYKKAFELDAGARDTLLMYATTEILAGGAEKAISLLENLLRNDPSYPQAVLLLTEAYLCNGRKEDGLRYAEKLDDLRLDRWKLLTGFAKILVSAGRFDYASSLLEVITENSNATDEVRGLLEECRPHLSNP